jgi:class 3 adenylate cyclase
VNLAARLESSTKEVGVDVLMSETTYAATRDIVDAREVQRITVKGREQPVLVYEVLGLVRATPSDEGGFERSSG